MSVTIYHNPRCSKSRQTMQLLQSKQIAATVVEYLKQPPTKSELKAILKKLNLSARELLRTKEAQYQQLGLDDMQLSEDQLIDAMLQYPVLMERPIVICGNKAAIGRPPEKILEILND